MPDEKPKNEDGQEPKPQTGDRIIDGRLDPDAQSPDNERDKPFDPKENDPA
ncbi:hypothetical protein [Methylobacterium platani]|uniref:hypothetical protein n=1 Tax=Methylobacterium platani TaxID=427683 RepID=UPI000A8486D1|nr:hypothetical protein [Methylobacterium platani]